MLRLFMLAIMLAASSVTMPVVAEGNGSSKKCSAYRDGAHLLQISPNLARQGATLTITPMYVRAGPFVGFEPMPVKCISRWSVSVPGAASLSPDKSTLTIEQAAEPGSDVTISASVGKSRMETVLRIVGRNQVVLTGKRSQVAAEGCGNARPVGELVFESDGRYTVTHQPFETFVDYSGIYRWDDATGALQLFSSSNSDTPRMQGIARFDGGKLILEGIMLDLKQPPPLPGEPGVENCRLTF